MGQIQPASGGGQLLMVTAAALVDGGGRLLVQRRPAGKPMAGLWELPGGKLEDGETPEAGLVRELREELAIEVDVRDLYPACFASHAHDDRHLLLLVFLCRRWKGEPQAHAADALLWQSPAELRSLAMPPADAPLIDLLERLI